MHEAINFLERFIEQKSVATLAEYRQVIGALNDLRKFADDHQEVVTPGKPGKKVPFPGAKVSDKDLDD